MNEAENLPAARFPDLSAGTVAEAFLDEVIEALTAVDAPALRRLEFAAPKILRPVNRIRYAKRRAVFAALLEVSARNLRFLRRAAAIQPSGPYAPGHFGHKARLR